MDIKIITCHDVYNHGASLQTYALMTYLKSISHNVEIIDYRPNYLTNKYSLLAVSNTSWANNIVKKLIYILLKLPIRIYSLRRKIQFDRFTKKYLTLTSIRYKNNTELKTRTPEADAYICGSDQIWNSLFNNGKDPAFYLDFVPDNKIKISYAPSFAINKIQDNYKAFVYEKVKRIDHVSVRESSGLKILIELGIENPTLVVDPVFLLGKNIWDKLIEKIKIKYDNYLLVYDFDNSTLIKEISLNYAKKKNMKVITINDIRQNYSSRNLWHISPLMFVALIKNASCIISNSYHATVFSLIFEKQFYVVKRQESINTRMIDLLSILEITDRIISSNNDISDDIIDYNSCNKIIDQLTTESKTFLENALK